MGKEAGESRKRTDCRPYCQPTRQRRVHSSCRPSSTRGREMHSGEREGGRGHVAVGFPPRVGRDGLF